MKVNSTDSL
jgi:hypothetical protein